MSRYYGTLESVKKNNSILCKLCFNKPYCEIFQDILGKIINIFIAALYVSHKELIIWRKLRLGNNDTYNYWHLHFRRNEVIFRINEMKRQSIATYVSPEENENELLGVGCFIRNRISIPKIFIWIIFFFHKCFNHLKIHSNFYFKSWLLEYFYIYPPAKI